MISTASVQPQRASGTTWCARRWYPRIYFGQPEKGLSHRALADIQDSIRELQYYRATAFVPQPGPTTDEIKQAAAELPPAE